MTPPGATPYSQLYLVGSSGNDDVTATYSPASVTFTLAAGTFDQSASDAGGCDDQIRDRSRLSADHARSTRSCSPAWAATTRSSPRASRPPFPSSRSAAKGQRLARRRRDESEDDPRRRPGRPAPTCSVGLRRRRRARSTTAAPTNSSAATATTSSSRTRSATASAIVGGPGRDNASWARFKDEAAPTPTSAAASPAARRPTRRRAAAANRPTRCRKSRTSRAPKPATSSIGDAGPNQLLGRTGSDAYFAGCRRRLDPRQLGRRRLGRSTAVADDDAATDRPPPVRRSRSGRMRERLRSRPEQLPAPATLLPPPPLPDAAANRRRPTLAPAADEARSPIRGRSLVTRKAWRRVAFRFAASEPGSTLPLQARPPALPGLHLAARLPRQGRPPRLPRLRDRPRRQPRPHPGAVQVPGASAASQLGDCLQQPVEVDRLGDVAARSRGRWGRRRRPGSGGR